MSRSDTPMSNGPARVKPLQTYHALVALGFASDADRTAFVATFARVPSTVVTSATSFDHQGAPALVLGLAYTARGANRTDISSKLQRAASLSDVDPVVLRDLVGLAVRLPPVAPPPAVAPKPTGTPEAAPVPSAPTRRDRLPLDAITARAIANAENSPGGLPRLVAANGAARMVYDGDQRPTPTTVEDRNALVDQVVAKTARELNGADAGALIFLTHNEGARFTVVHAFDRGEHHTYIAPVSDGVPADMTVTGPWAEVPDHNRFDRLHTT